MKGVSVAVALRKESVDRNQISINGMQFTNVSLSARRAWIEIQSYEEDKYKVECRSPQGERG